MARRIPNRHSDPLLINLAIAFLFVAITPTIQGQTVKRDYQYADAPLASMIEEIVKPSCVSVVIDQTAKDFVNRTRVDFQLSNATSVDALWFLFQAAHLDYDYDGKGLVVYKGTAPKEIKNILRIVKYQGDLGAFINVLAEQANLKAESGESLHLANRRAEIDITDVSSLRVLQTVLAAQRLTYEHTTCEEILIVPKTAVAFYWRIRTSNN